MSIIQYIISAFAVFAIARAVYQFKQGTLTFPWLLFWMIFWLAAGVVAVLPQTADAVAQFVGVGRGADAVIYGSLIVLFSLIFRLYVKIESVESEMTRLVRVLALEELKREE